MTTLWGHIYNRGKKPTYSALGHSLIPTVFSRGKGLAGLTSPCMGFIHLLVLSSKAQEILQPNAACFCLIPSQQGFFIFSALLKRPFTFPLPLLLFLFLQNVKNNGHLEYFLGWLWK